MGISGRSHPPGNPFNQPPGPIVIHMLTPPQEPSFMRYRLLSLALLVAAAPLFAQQTSRAERFLRNCDDSGNDEHERFCEVRDVRLKAPERMLFIDGRDNGGV